MSKRKHYFFNIKLAPHDAETYRVEVTQWHKPFGLIIHCLFWSHLPQVVNTADADLRWVCRDCLLAEHRKARP